MIVNTIIRRGPNNNGWSAIVVAEEPSQHLLEKVPNAYNFDIN